MEMELVQAFIENNVITALNEWIILNLHCAAHRNIAILENSIKSGINDADAETRTISRRTYWIYYKSFEDKAEQMMKTFDNSKQKMLRETKIGQSTGQATSPTGSTSSTL